MDAHQLTEIKPLFTASIGKGKNCPVLHVGRDPQGLYHWHIKRSGRIILVHPTGYRRIAKMRSTLSRIISGMPDTLVKVAFLIDLCYLTCTVARARKGEYRKSP